MTYLRRRYEAVPPADIGREVLRVAFGGSQPVLRAGVGGSQAVLRAGVIGGPPMFKV
jgi:hypothetical protein